MLKKCTGMIGLEIFKTLNPFFACFTKCLNLLPKRWLLELVVIQIVEVINHARGLKHDSSS